MLHASGRRPTVVISQLPPPLFLSNITPNLLVRRSMIEMILATDMAKHFKYLSQFRAMLETKRMPLESSGNGALNDDLMSGATYVTRDLENVSLKEGAD